MQIHYGVDILKVIYFSTSIMQSVFHFFHTIRNTLSLLLFTRQQKSYLYHYHKHSVTDLRSLLSRYTKQRKDSTDLLEQFKLTRRISQISDIITEKKWKIYDTPFERFSTHIQPWDLLFFLWWTHLKRWDVLLQKISLLPINHVGLVGYKQPRNFYQSTGKASPRGAVEVELEAELQRRWPAITVLVARPSWKQADIASILRKAKSLHKQRIKYSIVDALSSALGLGAHLDGNMMNCGDFAHECLKADTNYRAISDPGIPCNLLRRGDFQLIYATTL